MTQAPSAVDHVGRDFFVAALAEFYATTGFVEAGPHQQTPVPDQNAVRNPPGAAGRIGGTRCRAVACGPDLIADRRDAGPRLAVGQPIEIELSVYGTRPVRIRDRIPADWTVDAADRDDASTTYTEGGVRYVEFAIELAAGTLTYVATPPDHYCATCVGFGPIEYSLDDGDTWLPVAATHSQHTRPCVDTGT